jgi:hypothetical protein
MWEGSLVTKFCERWWDLRLSKTRSRSLFYARSFARVWRPQANKVIVSSQIIISKVSMLYVTRFHIIYSGKSRLYSSALFGGIFHNMSNRTHQLLLIRSNHLPQRSSGRLVVENFVQ